MSDEDVDSISNIKNQLYSYVINDKTLGLGKKEAVAEAVKSFSTPNKIINQKIKDFRKGIAEGKKPFKQIKEETKKFIRDNSKDFKNISPSQGRRILSLVNMKSLSNGSMMPDVRRRVEEITDTIDLSTMSTKNYNNALRNKAIYENRQFDLDRNNLTDDQIQTLVGMYNAVSSSKIPTDINKLTQQDIDKAFNLNQSLIKKNFSSSEIRNINRLNTGSVDAMPTEDMESLIAELESIKQEQKQIESQRKIRDKKKLDSDISELDKQIEEQGLSTSRRGTFNLKDAKAKEDKQLKGLGRFLKQGNANMFTMSTIMDKGTGFFHKKVYEPIREGLREVSALKDKYASPVEKVTKKYKDIFKEDFAAYTDSAAQRTLQGKDKQGRPYEVRLTGDQMLTIYMHSLNADNRAAMMIGGLNVKGEESADSWRPTEETIEEIQRFVDNSKAYKELANAMKDSIKQMGDDLTQAYSLVTGGSIKELYSRADASGYIGF
jgi:hypothetical protein